MTRIYLVDDHKIVREGLRAMLEAKGHQVVGDSADLVEALSDRLDDFRTGADQTVPKLLLGDKEPFPVDDGE